MSSITLYPRGNVLTEPMPFTGPDGSPWLAYIEGVAEPRDYPAEAPALPGRRLRFDSHDESRAVREVPPGSPFLPDAQLQQLLSRAEILPPPSTATWHPRQIALRIDLPRYWRDTASRRRLLLEQASRGLSVALDATVAFVARLASGRGPGPADDPPDSHPVARRPRTPRWARRPRAK
jgi:hypothetical protein